MGVFGSQRCQIDGRPDHMPDALRRQIRCVGRAHALADQHAQARASRAGLFQRLHFAHAHVRGKFVALGNGAFGIGGARVERLLDNGLCNFRQVSNVKPSPRRSCDRCARSGFPTPTGTLWPSLPQTPMPSSSFRSFPTMLTYFIASGPLPISVALRTGRVSLPSSIR